jgi:WD40 repeat protein
MCTRPCGDPTLCGGPTLCSIRTCLLTCLGLWDALRCGACACMHRSAADTPSAAAHAQIGHHSMPLSPASARDWRMYIGRFQCAARELGCYRPAWLSAHFMGVQLSCSLVVPTCSRFTQIGCFSSLLSYSAHEGAVTDVCILSDDGGDAVHVASIDSTGQLHLWDVSVQPRQAVSQRPTLAFPPASPSHLSLDSGHLTRMLQWGGLLLVASEAGGLRAYDARAGARGVWSVDVPPSHGVTTCLAAVPGSPALCSGTTRGMMHVWDMRMQVRRLRFPSSRMHAKRATCASVDASCPCGFLSLAERVCAAAAGGLPLASQSDSDTCNGVPARTRKPTWSAPLQ